ncbi:MAG: hypothetical protein AB4372_14155 [Xenococcus sp. (in: cyanobacteria)]
MSEQEKEQNKRINQLNRRVTNLERIVKTIDLDLEPGGRISEAFEALDNHLEEQDKKIDKLARDMNEVKASLNTILEHITGISDLPEE